MTIRKNEKKIYPRPHDRQIVFLKKVVTSHLRLIPFQSFSMNGIWIQNRSQMPGTTKGTSRVNYPAINCQA